MTAVAHLICKHRLNLSIVDKDQHIYESGYWDIPANEASALVGGVLYLHESKTTPSYFGGIVREVRAIEYPASHSKRIVFRIAATPDARGVKWAGAKHAMAWYGGLVKST